MTNTHLVNTLETYHKLHSVGQRRKFLQQSTNSFVIFICEGLKTLLAGHIPNVHSKPLQPYENQLRRLTAKTTSIKERRVILASPKGLALLSKTVGTILNDLRQWVQ